MCTSTIATAMSYLLTLLDTIQVLYVGMICSNAGIFEAIKLCGSRKSPKFVISVVFDFHRFYHTCSRIYVLYIPVAIYLEINFDDKLDGNCENHKICNPQNSLSYSSTLNLR